MKLSLSKDDVLICDIDGTLAKIGPRLQFAKSGNWNAFHLYAPQDEVHEHIAALVRLWYDLGGYVLIVTSRPKKYNVDTRAWLDRHGIGYDNLLMPYPENQHLPDEAKKRNLIAGWKVHNLRKLRFVLDDRQKVIDHLTINFRGLHGIRVNEELY